MHFLLFLRSSQATCCPRSPHLIEASTCINFVCLTIIIESLFKTDQRQLAVNLDTAHSAFELLKLTGCQYNGSGIKLAVIDLEFISHPCFGSRPNEIIDDTDLIILLMDSKLFLRSSAMMIISIT